jgi:hypothetical protein
MVASSRGKKTAIFNPPLDLQPVLARMCEGKLPTAPLFPSEKRTGRTRAKRWRSLREDHLSLSVGQVAALVE